jgi:HPt (histidine-containing phosphotransfer) domain-containing protein
MNPPNAVKQAQLNDLRDRESGVPELVADMIATFVEDSEIGLACLVKAVQAGDTAAVKREALLLKATAGLFGAEHLRATAEYLEAEAALSLANVRPLVARLRAELSEVQSALKRGVARC